MYTSETSVASRSSSNPCVNIGLWHWIFLMLAIDFPGKKRTFIMNSTTREMINDIFFNKKFKQAFKLFLKACLNYLLKKNSLIISLVVLFIMNIFCLNRRFLLISDTIDCSRFRRFMSSNFYPNKIYIIQVGCWASWHMIWGLIEFVLKLEKLNSFANY